MARKVVKGIVRRIRRKKATIDLEMGGSLKAPASSLKIGDKVVIGYDYTTMEVRNVWTEEQYYHENPPDESSMVSEFSMDGNKIDDLP